MKKVIRFSDKVIEIIYNSRTRLITRKSYTREYPCIVFIRKGFADEPLDMFFQSNKDLLIDVDFYTSSSRDDEQWLCRQKYFGKNGDKLKSYYER